MTRVIVKLAVLFCLVIGGVVGIEYYRQVSSVDHKVAQLVEEKQQLEQIVQRLTADRRVAQILVTDQKLVDGVTQTTLLLVETARDGSSLPPKSFTISGTDAHLDAMVIKFDREYVKQNDPLKGHSIALFTKLYGNHQSPDAGFEVDPPDRVPNYYRGTDAVVSTFEQNLWKDFWHLASDPIYRQQQGVRAASGEGPWWQCAKDTLYTVTLDNDGGLNVTSKPVEGVYQEALRQREEKK